MFCKLHVRRKSIVTLALSQDNRKIVVRYFVNRAPDSDADCFHFLSATLVVSIEQSVVDMRVCARKITFEPDYLWGPIYKISYDNLSIILR